MNDTPLNPLTDAGDFFVTLNAQNVARFPGLLETIQSFDAGNRYPAARAATEWLKAVDVTKRQESVTSLYFRDSALIGYYSLAMGYAELRQKQRNKLGLPLTTQPAALLTWIAKSAHHECDGAKLVADATYRALKATEYVAATVLALDPFDAATAKLWRDKHGFINSAKPGPGRALPRMIVPLPRSS